MNLNTAYRKLLQIHQECQHLVPSSKQQGDSFALARRQLHLDVKELRNLLTERDSNISSGYSGGKRGEVNYGRRQAELSHLIREKSLLCTEYYEKLRQVSDADEKKLSGMKKSSEQKLLFAKKVAIQKECVELCEMHLQECLNWEKQKISPSSPTEYYYSLMQPKAGNSGRKDHPAPPSAIISTSDTSKTARTHLHRTATMNNNQLIQQTQTPLPDIDVENDMIEIQQNNTKIDQELSDISYSVNQLREIAIEMGKDLTIHDEMIDNLQQKADKTETKLDTLNLRMKKTLDQVMSGDKFFVNTVLILLLLGLIFFIAGYF